MITYKGFDNELKCKDFQFEIGGEYEEEKAECCNTGFHAYEQPLDTFIFSPPNKSRYCIVEQSGEISKDDSDSNSKIASSKIKILKEIIEESIKSLLIRVVA